jgi:flagellar motor switch protein FliN
MAEKQTEPGATAATVIEDVDMTLSVELGRAALSLDAALDLSEQSRMELDRGVGQPVDVRLNGKLFARGEVVTVNEHFGVRLTEILTDVEN